MSTTYKGYVIIRNFAQGALSNVDLTWQGGNPHAHVTIANDLSIPEGGYSSWVQISPASHYDDDWTFTATMPNGKSYTSDQFEANMDNNADCVMVVSVDTDGQGGYRLIMYASGKNDVVQELHST